MGDDNLVCVQIGVKVILDHGALLRLHEGIVRLIATINLFAHEACAFKVVTLGDREHVAHHAKTDDQGRVKLQGSVLGGVFRRGGQINTAAVVACVAEIPGEVLEPVLANGARYPHARAMNTGNNQLQNAHAVNW